MIQIVQMAQNIGMYVEDEGFEPLVNHRYAVKRKFTEDEGGKLIHMIVETESIRGVRLLTE